MALRRVMCAACTFLFCVVATHPAAVSADATAVTYEVVSDVIRTANIEYQDAHGRIKVPGVALPWRMNVVLRTPLASPPKGSQIRADWRPNAAPTRWVTVRIIYRGKLVCQNSLDIGNAACYGATPRIT